MKIGNDYVFEISISGVSKNKVCFKMVHYVDE